MSLYPSPSPRCFPFQRRGAEGAEQRREEEMHENEISERIIGAAIEVHRVLGPGLLESIYEEALCHEFHLRNIRFERQRPVPVDYKGVKLATNLRLDLLVEEKVIVDVKAKEEMTDKDHAKTLTYLRLTNTRLGLNINFHEPRLVDGIKRVANNIE
jgi:GxxExxY protein